MFILKTTVVLCSAPEFGKEWELDPMVELLEAGIS
jgi:hypothetical protein